MPSPGSRLYRKPVAIANRDFERTYAGAIKCVIGFPEGIMPIQIADFRCSKLQRPSGYYTTLVNLNFPSLPRTSIDHVDKSIRKRFSILNVRLIFNCSYHLVGIGSQETIDFRHWIAQAVNCIAGFLEGTMSDQTPTFEPSVF